MSFVLPDGRTLFSNLSEVFDTRHTGLVGRNGSGKSLLTRLLAGQLEPSSGQCLRSGRVGYLSQHITELDHATVAGLAGLQPALDALDRIEAGSDTAADLELLGARWNLRQRLQAAFEHSGLGHLQADTPADTLSDGEAKRVALLGVMLDDPDFLVLDEPGNHLDADQRAALITQLAGWTKGLLVVSQDRPLLEAMERIVELSPLGLRSCDGGYSAYARHKAGERARALQWLEQRRAERRSEQQALGQQRHGIERRHAAGRRQGLEADHTKVLHAFTAPQPLHRVAELVGVQLPHVAGATRGVDLVVEARQRIGVIGANACGKSTLLKVLAGELPPLSGSCEVHVTTAHLDQRLDSLLPGLSVAEQLLDANPLAGANVLRMQLDWLGLDAAKVAIESGRLSGGERLKAALVCALYADPPAELLLLDEPSNHLDLPSVHALETMLQDNQGALLVVSHDEAFLENLGLTHRLIAGADGWRLEPW